MGIGGEEAIVDPPGRTGVFTCVQICVSIEDARGLADTMYEWRTFAVETPSTKLLNVADLLAAAEPQNNVVQIDPILEEMKRGDVNPATICQASIEILERVMSKIAEYKDRVGVRQLADSMLDVIRVQEFLGALRDRAMEGKVVDLEKLGVWKDLQQ